jgi:hypothetical protein
VAKIVWLASYPKSGNTWLRAFLTNFRHNASEPADINALDSSLIASTRHWFDDIVGIEASQLLDEEILALRPDFYRYAAAESAETLYLKIHDAYLPEVNGKPIVPADVTQGVIYVLRNPLDVVISFSHHNHQSIAQTVQFINNTQATLARTHNKVHDQLPQRLRSWSQHVQSWLDQSDIPVYCIRYEDMKRDPTAVFTNVVRFLGLPDDPERISQAVANASFETLQSQEKQHGFRERISASAFFRQGRSGQWLERLTPEEIACICHEHAATMQRFGYLSPTGETIIP